MAAAISFHVLFSLFPLAILLVAVLGLVLRDESLRQQVVDFLLRRVPLSPRGRSDLERLITGVTGGSSALGLLGLLGLAWSASGMMAALRAALNAAWGLEGGRSFVRGKLLDLGLMAALGLLFLLSLGLTVAVRVGREIAGSLGSFGSGAALVVFALGLLLPLCLSFLSFLFVYTIVPAARPRAREVWPAALLAAVGLELLTNGFAFYLAYFGSYNAVYGSLGAVVAFLFFVFLAANLLIFGAELASERRRDLEQAQRAD